MTPVSQFNFFHKEPVAETVSLESSMIVTETENLLQNLSEKYRGLEGVAFQSDLGMKLFLGLPLEKKQAAHLKLLNYAHFLDGAADEGLDIENNAQCLKSILTRLGLSVSDNFFSHLSDDDIVEVYDGSFIQIYRNLKCLRLSSYDLLTLCSFEWPQLFERDANINQALVEEAVSVLDQGHDIYLSKVPEHLMLERLSFEKRKMIIKNKVGGIVCNSDKQIAGFVCTQSANVVSDETSLSFLRSH